MASACNLVLPSSGENEEHMGGQTGEKQIELHYHLQSQKKFGRTDEARGGDDVASGYEFFKGTFGKHLLKQLKIIIFLVRSLHRRAGVGL